MGIRFYCPDCGRRMNVKSFLAGRRGICPHCEARFEIPQESEIPKGAPRFRPTEGELKPASAKTVSTAAVGVSTIEPQPETDLPGPIGQDSVVQESVVQESIVQDPIQEAPEAVWYVRPPSGGQFGPARGDAMRRWLDEGRVSADSLVWREGWPDWAVAGDWFPELTSPSATPTDESAERPAALLQLTEAADPVDRVRRRPARRSGIDGKSIAVIVILGLLIVTLVGVLVVVVSQSG